MSWQETQTLIQSCSKVLLASGEFLAQLFVGQQQLKGIPDEGYWRRPLIGLRLELPSGHVLTCRPGWQKSYGDKAGQLLLDRVDLELLGPGKLLADPLKAFARQQDHCCCCGKRLTDITSRLRGIGPECIRYFKDVVGIAAAVRAKPQYRSLDAEWNSGLL